ncbi:hypothetical protein K435DRAFT_801344 [Dendrothele bispora CBS 962.96]|uniref:Uncharacterized protein n=1 Tax=Dendrothele bispora (strain CBS 962.96) TaxID=1314807 RepID=A0A4S8LPP2_DENBC|nr:hypothetical protein K435DRAFT_801344 [Dendrothele bispora CBS 962.96]
MTVHRLDFNHHSSSGRLPFPSSFKLIWLFDSMALLVSRTTVIEYVMKVWVEGMPSPLCLPQCPGYTLIPTRDYRHPSPSTTHNYSRLVTSTSSVIILPILISFQQHASTGGQVWFKNYVGNILELLITFLSPKNRDCDWI